LRWEDVDLKAGTLAVRGSLKQTRGRLTFKEPKTAKSRGVIAVLSVTVAALRRHGELRALRKLEIGPIYRDSGMVCAKSDGTLINPESLSMDFPAMLRKRGLPPVRLHD
jgi:integrase